MISWNVHVLGFLSLYASYKDLRGLPELMDKTLLVIKAPPDTIMECDNEEEVGMLLISTVFTMYSPLICRPTKCIY